MFELAAPGPGPGLMNGDGASGGQRAVASPPPLRKRLSHHVTLGVKARLSSGVSWLFWFLTFETFSTQGPFGGG